MTVTSRWIDIPADGDSFQGYLALPKGGKGPAVIIIQEIFGVNSHIRAVADQYAADGYVALAPDIFWRTQPRVELGYEGADREKGDGIAAEDRRSESRRRHRRGRAALRALPEVTGKVAAIGYCFGGRLAYLAAAQGTIDLGVRVLRRRHPERSSTRPTRSRCRCSSTTANSTRTFRWPRSARCSERFAGRNDAEFHIYPNADHGFNCTRPRVVQPARLRAGARPHAHVPRRASAVIGPWRRVNK